MIRMKGLALVAVATIAMEGSAWAGERPVDAPSGPPPQFEVCHTALPTLGRLGAPNYTTLYVSAVMARGPINDADISQAFAKFLQEKYQVSGGAECFPAQTREAAQQALDNSKAAVHSALPSAAIVETGWTYTPPAKVVAATPASYAVCWAHFNARVKYYSSIFDGRVDDARQWVPAFEQFLKTKYQFDGPAQCLPGAAQPDAQKYLNDLIAADRKTRTMDGQPPQIVETGWTYSKAN